MNTNTNTTTNTEVNILNNGQAITDILGQINGIMSKPIEVYSKLSVGEYDATFKGIAIMVPNDILDAVKASDPSKTFLGYNPKKGADQNQILIAFRFTVNETEHRATVAATQNTSLSITVSHLAEQLGIKGNPTLDQLQTYAGKAIKVWVTPYIKDNKPGVNYNFKAPVAPAQTSALATPVSADEV